MREEVAFMVIAGDLYDGTWRDYQTGLFLVSEMARLRAARPAASCATAATSSLCVKQSCRI